MFDLTINFQKLRDDLIPLYKLELDSLLKVLTAPIITLYITFKNFRSDSKYTLRHNSQVIYLRKVLNDRFNTDTITILDGVNLTETYIYREIEGQSKVLYKDSENETESVLYRKSEYEVTTDFFIQVPMVLNLTSAQLIELKALVKYYALPNKNFEIQLI